VAAERVGTLRAGYFAQQLAQSPTQQAAQLSPQQALQTSAAETAATGNKARARAARVSLIVFIELNNDVIFV